MRRISGYLVMAAVVLVVMVAVPTAVQADEPHVVLPLKVGVSQPVRDLPKATPEEGTREVNPQNVELPERILNAGAGDGPADPVVQNFHYPNAMPPPIMNFEGVPNVNGVLPPDTQGDVGVDYYVQWINLSFDIYDKATGVSVIGGPVNGNSLWTGFGGSCEGFNSGDPITLYDHLAGRWFMSQFTGDNHQCIAVSQTGDPTGAWWLYDYLADAGSSWFPDYPKFGLWPDGYYYTASMFGNGSNMSGVFERDQMLIGGPAQFIWFYVDDTNAFPSWRALPADLDGGTMPPAGAPNPFVQLVDDVWAYDPPYDQDGIAVIPFHVDWVTPGNSTFGPPAMIDLTAAGYPFDSSVCPAFRGQCIPQPGGPNLEALHQQLMHKLQYRNFGTHETLIATHTVDADGTEHAGVRWYELRDSSGGWGIHQGGTYAPDSDHRWMADAAMDTVGNIAVGYSVSSTTTFPSIRWTGRLVGDPLDTLPQGEDTVIAGAGSQTHSAARWGDYSSMNLDPLDDCTFWYTQEYMPSTSSAGWQTRIASFKYPTCSTGPTGTVRGTVISSATLLPIDGATVEVGGFATATDGAGFYSVIVPVDTYDVTASKFGYTPQTVMGIVVGEDDVITQDFALDPVGEASLDGYVTDAGHGWPLYAMIEIESGGMWVATVFTDPFNGYYELELPQGMPYDLMVYPGYPGYDPVGRGIVLAPPPGQTESFVLTANSSCEAPGYEAAGPGAPSEVPSIPRITTNVPGNTGPSSMGRAPAVGEGQPSPANPDLPLAPAPAFGMDVFPGLTLVNWPDVTVPGSWTVVAGGMANFYSAGDFLLGDFSTLYAIDFNTNNFSTVDTTTGAQTVVGLASPNSGEFWTGVTASVGGVLYASGSTCSTSTLYTIDIATGAATAVGPITNGPCIIDIAINAAGEMYGVDIVGDILVQIDPSTGAGTVIGSTGVAANFAQGMDFDEETGVLYWASYHAISELRIIDTTTGASAPVGAFPGGAEVDAFAIAFFSGGGCELIPGALAVGFVSDANTFEAINGADVVNDIGGATMTVPTPDDPNIPDGAYYLFTPLPTSGPSTRTFTASAPDYGDEVVVVNMVPETVNQIDFALGAGWLELAPDHLESRLNAGMTEDQLLEVLNYGTLEANVALNTVLVPSEWPHNAPVFDLENLPGSTLPTSIGLAPAVGEGPSAVPNPNLLLASVPAFGMDLIASDLVNWPDLTVPGAWTVVSGGMGQFFAGDFLLGDFSTMYVLDYGSNMLVTVDTASGAITAVGPAPPGGGESWTGVTGAVDGTLYASSAACGANSTLYTVDPATGATTPIGSITNGTCIIDIAINPAGEMYGVDIVNDNLVQIDPATGAGTIIGSVGVNANFAQGMDFDDMSGILYWASYSSQGELRILDTATGASTLVGPFPGGTEVGSLGIATFAGGGPGLPWLVLTPDEGVVPPAAAEPGVLPINAEFLADEAPHFGLYRATISAFHDTPYDVNDASVCFTKAFDDVAAGFWADGYIHSLAGGRITQGCGGADFCPTDLMIRNVMARWLVNAYYGPDFTPMVCAETFPDVPCETTPNSDYIEQIFADGITTGCSTDPLLFCPYDTVNRAQMATFITRLAYGPDFVPPPATGTMYPDVAPGMPGWWAADYIEWLTAEGIVSGFPDGTYRPLDPTTRAQMAKMVVISIGVPMCEVPE